MIKAILTDIEGTCTSLSFVKQTLFPYARARIADYVKQHRNDSEIASQLAAVRTLMKNPQANIDEVCEQLTQWIDQDNKATPLKAIQGYLWQQGYEHKDYYGHLYPDAYQKFTEWYKQGLLLCVFSSGSVKAQKLLFAHTEFGDLTGLFSAYFDTSTGAKGDPNAYRRIATQIGITPEHVLFLSDIEAELDAAQSAGMQTRCLQRENALTPKSKHRCHPDFAAINVE